MEDASKLGVLQREYSDEMFGFMYAIEYSPRGTTYEGVMCEREYVHMLAIT